MAETYRIEHITDLLTVPSDRRAECVKNVLLSLQLSELATRCKALADEIETAALEIDEYVTAKDVDAGKLKQLQALLKGLA